MLVVDVGNHGYRRKQFQKRSIALVGLGHHQLAAAEPRVAAKGAESAANHRRRIETGPFEHQRDHRRRRRLAVRPGDRDRRLQAHQLREHFGPRNHRHLAPRRLAHLGVGHLHRRRHDDHVRIADVRRVVPVRDPNPERRQPLGHRRSLLVGPADRVSQVREQLGDAAHANATNADEMYVARFTKHRATCGVRFGVPGAGFLVRSGSGFEPRTPNPEPRTPTPERERTLNPAP